jgi:hypothetical protein
VTELREKYKKIDLLLIDDIQFLERSESTQEEFFHIFNAMHEIGKQIVITSDKPPKKLVTLEDRLKSRFEWGLTTDIKTPNLETRTAIIKKKSVKLGIEISDEITNFIAEKLTSNIRELEGLINRIYAYHQLSDEEITMDFVKDIIKNLMPHEEDEEPQKDNQSPAAPAKAVNVPAPGFPPPPSNYPPSPAQQQPMLNMCQRCGVQMTFIPQFQKWYCTSCGTYSDQMSFFPSYHHPQSTAVNVCKRCNIPLSYVPEYHRYYCNNCKEYAPQEVVSPSPVPPPPPGSMPPPPPGTMPPPQPAPTVAPPVNKVSPEPVKKAPEKKAKVKHQKSKKEDKVGFEDRVIGKEKDNIREIRTGYFMPDGSENIFASIVDKLDKLATQKKFNFFIKPLFAHRYASEENINYDKIAHMSKTNNVDIAILLKPKVDAAVFKNKLTEAMDKEGVPFEIIAQEDMKESDALNFMLDIAICARKRDG